MNSLKHQIDCLGVVLAGGLSSRMGQNKAMLRRNSTSMLNFSKNLLQQCGVDKVVVSGGRSLTQENSLGLNAEIIPDKIEHAGPVGGIYSVIQQCNPKSLLILPVDLPLMTADSLNKLKTTGELSQKASYFDDHHIPLYLPNNAFLAMFLNNAFTALAQNIADSSQKNAPSIKQMLLQVPHLSVKSPQVKTLFNSNTPTQWQEAQRILNLNSA
ncbi:MAG: molybdenum cofactor guanylyltransferase [Colwellia sp.]